MFIKKTTKRAKGKSYTNHLLVESVATPKGPRHRVVCSLGSLSPAPAEEWLSLAHRIEAGLQGQTEIQRDEKVEAIVARVRAKRSRARRDETSGDDGEVVSVRADKVETEEAREAGPVHVGHETWKRLGLDGVLSRVGLSDRARRLTEAMTLNRLVFPLSEHAMPDWIRRTALGDILGETFETLAEDSLYRNLDRLHGARTTIEKELSERERTLFNLKESIFLYDLTSTYFEGECESNARAKRGYSRDGRPDAKQVVVGLVLDGDGFPKAHEVFDGNRVDTTTVDEMLVALEKRVGNRAGATVVVDRGMAYKDNLKQIRDHGYHYLVASRQEERSAHLAEFEKDAGFAEVVRETSPTNPAQEKSRVVVKRKEVGDEVFLLCVSDGRRAKDRAIREKHEGRLLADLRKLSVRVAKGRLRDEGAVREAIGRVRERYPRVARYYTIAHNAEEQSLSFDENKEKKAIAERLDGSYILRTDRKDLSEDEIWKTYTLLTRVEAAFRAMKSPLAERPIFHKLDRRVETHIFLCVLAYHLLVSIERQLQSAGIHASWANVREELATHQVVTVVLPTTSGDVLKIRKATTPEPRHREIYEALRIRADVIRPAKTWVLGPVVTEKPPNFAKHHAPT